MPPEEGLLVLVDFDIELHPVDLAENEYVTMPGELGERAADQTQEVGWGFHPALWYFAASSSLTPALWRFAASCST